MSFSNNNGSGRRAPNVSQYLQNLNNIPSAQELAAQQNAALDFDHDTLDFLVNTEFLDYDQPFQSPPDQHVFQAVPEAGAHVDARPSRKGSGMNAQYPPAPHFSEFQTYPTAPLNTGMLPSTLPSSTSSTPTAYHASPGGDKLEEASRLAAEEDKRRRNTAASARFRVKKKQREQALEKATRDLQDKVAALESKNQRLEMENSWLKGLITEKEGGKVLEKMGVLGSREEKVEDERSTEQRKRGIGTEIAKEEE